MPKAREIEMGSKMDTTTPANDAGRTPCLASGHTINWLSAGLESSGWENAVRQR